MKYEVRVDVSKPIEVAYKTFLIEFKKQMNINKDKVLRNYQYNQKFVASFGKVGNAKQIITEDVSDYSLIIESTNGDRVSLSKFYFEKINENTCVYVNVEDNISEKSFFSKTNEVLFHLPVLRGSTIKKMRKKGYYIRNVIEGKPI